MDCMCAGVLGGVIAYTAQDIHFTPLGYMWIGIWYAFAVFEQVWVKKVVDTVAMTTWSRTYYQAWPTTVSLYSCTLGCRAHHLQALFHMLHVQTALPALRNGICYMLNIPAEALCPNTLGRHVIIAG